MKGKKLLSLGLSAMMVASLLAGCGSKDTGSDTKKEGGSKSDKTTITVLTNRTDLAKKGGEFDDYVKKFQETNPDIDVKFQALKDYEGDVAIRLQTEDYGDVLMLPDSIPANEFKDFFEPLGTVDELKEKYDEKFLTAKISDGNVYGLAAFATAAGVVYNKKVFQDAGVTETPKTPDEFIAALKKVKENTKSIPYYTNYKDSWALKAWEDHAWGSVSGDADYKNNKIISEKDPFKKGSSHYTVYKLLYDIVKNGLCEEDPSTTNWEESKKMLNSGEIASMVLGSWAISQVQGIDEANKDNIGFMPFPYTQADGKQTATAGTDYCYAINKNSDKKEAARKWIDFMLDESGFALSQGGISIKKTDELPDNLSEFEGVDLVVDSPAASGNEGKYDDISKNSEVDLSGSETEKQRIVDAALGKSGESLDDIMNDWNKKWNKQLEASK